MGGVESVGANYSAMALVLIAEFLDRSGVEAMIKCDECGTKYHPVSDTYRCPCCGESNYPPDNDDCIYDRCQVCGLTLQNRWEKASGLCDRCA